MAIVELGKVNLFSDMIFIHLYVIKRFSPKAHWSFESQATTNVNVIRRLSADGTSIMSADSTLSLDKLTFNVELESATLSTDSAVEGQVSRYVGLDERIDANANIKSRLIRRQNASATIQANANIVTKPFARIRHMTGDSVYIGVGSTFSLSRFWRYKVIRSSVEVESELNLYYYNDRDIMRDVWEYMPEYYEDSFDVQAITQTKGNEFIRFHALALNVLDQFFPNRATWGLDRWEQEFKIETDRTRPIEERRAEIIERIAGVFLVTDDFLVKEAKKFYPNVELHFRPLDMAIDIYFPDNQAPIVINPKFVQRLTDLIPCHLEFSIYQRSLQWGEPREKRVSWKEFKTKGVTWGNVKRTVLGTSERYARNWGELGNPGIIWGNLSDSTWGTISDTGFKTGVVEQIYNEKGEPIL